MTDKKTYYPEHAIKFLKKKGVFIDDINDVRSAIHYEFAELMAEYATQCVKEFALGYNLAKDIFENSTKV